MTEFKDLKKNLRKDNTGHRSVRLAVVADTASQFLCMAIAGYGYERRVAFDIYEADYDQLDLQIFDPSSGLYAAAPQFIFLNTSTEKLLKEFNKKDRQAQEHFAEYVLARTRTYLDTLLSRTQAKVILNTYPEINDAVFGNFAGKTQSSFRYQLLKLNLLLMDAVREYPGVFLCDIASLQGQHGRAFSFDTKMYVNADIVYSLDFLPYVAKAVTDVVLSILGDFKKCLILDLDNTTWGGIIGDDGVEGIQIGYLGIGKAFTELQSWARQLSRRGIILAVCSKNTDEIAREPFISHPDMVLRLEDIAVFVANWETKVDNIRHIQSVLNIGFDSMVFLDDNPFEREMVRSAIPTLTIPDLPEDPAEYLPYLRSLNLFETASFTGEDTERTKQYQVEAQRAQLQQSFASEHEFLASLNMLAHVAPFSRFTIPRVAQLTQRSNQFNLRTVRYTEEDVTRISESPSHLHLTFSLADRFGDHGLIAVVILEKQDDSTLFIDTWIMSCRVLKRGMEAFTLNTIVDLALFHNFDRIVGEYLPTPKNGIVKDHYESLGFHRHGQLWSLPVKDYKNKEVFISSKQIPANG